MTEEELDMEAKAKLATQGKWRSTECFAGRECWCKVVDLGDDDKDGIIPSGAVTAVNADHIGASHPEAVLRLIERIRKLEEAK